MATPIDIPTSLHVLPANIEERMKPLREACLKQANWKSVPGFAAGAAAMASVFNLWFGVLVVTFGVWVLINFRSDPSPESVELNHLNDLLNRANGVNAEFAQGSIDAEVAQAQHAELALALG